MKLLLHILILIIVTFILQSFLPWWSMAIGAFAIAYGFAHSGIKSFLAGFIAIGLVWLGLAIYIDVASASILTTKVAQLFPTKTVPLLFVLTVFIGGLVGGMASLTGAILSYRPRKKW